MEDLQNTMKRAAERFLLWNMARIFMLQIQHAIHFTVTGTE